MMTTNDNNHNEIITISSSPPPITPKRPNLPARDAPHQSQHHRAIVDLPNMGIVEAVYINERPHSPHTPKPWPGSSKRPCGTLEGVTWTVFWSPRRWYEQWCEERYGEQYGNEYYDKGLKEVQEFIPGAPLVSSFGFVGLRTRMRQEGVEMGEVERRQSMGIAQKSGRALGVFAI